MKKIILNDKKEIKKLKKYQKESKKLDNTQKNPINWLS